MMTKEHFILTKGEVHPEDATITGMYVPKNRA